jgi:DNA-binding PadR family transcriptional regulator
MSYSGFNLIDDNVKCSCKGNNLDKLVQPQILTVLARQDLHGYLIIQELEDKYLLGDDQIDKTGVYRALRTLEVRELVRFEWILNESGPAKKNYRITEKGIECLNTWIHSLEVYKASVEMIIKNAKDAIAGGESK